MTEFCLWSKGTCKARNNTSECKTINYNKGKETTQTKKRLRAGNEDIDENDSTTLRSHQRLARNLKSNNSSEAIHKQWIKNV